MRARGSERSRRDSAPRAPRRASTNASARRRIADLEQHREDVLVGAAVARALERRDGGGHRGVQIGQGGDGHTRRERRRIQLMVGVKIEDEVQHPRHLRGGLPSLEQVEEVRGVGEVPPRGHRLAAGPDPLPCRDGGGHEAHQPLRLADIGGLVARARVRIECGGQRHRRAEGVERVAVPGQSPQQREHGLGQVARGRERAAKGRRLRGRGELAEPEQIRHVLEARPRRELADLVAPVVEASLRAIHLADGRPRRDHVLEPVLPERLRLHGRPPRGRMRTLVVEVDYS